MTGDELFEQAVLDATGFTVKELAEAEIWLKDYGDGATDVYKAALGLRCFHKRKAKAKKSRLLIGGAVRALTKGSK